MLNHLFSPIRIGTLEIENRMVVPAMATNYCSDEGRITEKYIKYMEEKAKGGFKLLFTEDYEVYQNGKASTYLPSLRDDSMIEGNRKLTEAVHKYGTKIFCQLYHPGRQISHFGNGGVQPISPSAIKDPVTMDLPRTMTKEDIDTIVKAFGDAARRAKEAGFDGVELHCGHGYLVAQFLSPFFNRRNDEYGGSFQNRTRFMDECFAAIRKNVGEDYPISGRISGVEYVEGGRTEAESCQLARHMEAIGFDMLNISNGAYDSPTRCWPIGPMFMDHAFNRDIAGEIKKLVNIPVMLSNRINEPELADTMIALGKADLIGFGRGSICDPYLPQKAAEGRFNEIHQCIGCLQGCAGAALVSGPVTCVVNPRVGREYECDLSKVDQLKKVMVVGGGPAGLKVAEFAATRGHNVCVYEKEDVLGGQWNAAAYPVGKGELTNLVTSLKASLDELKVPVKMGTEVTEEVIVAEKPDAIVLATGARPLTPPIEGIHGDNVVAAEDLLTGKADSVMGPVVVCGGGEVGGETAEFLAQGNRDVTILEMRPDILNDMMLLMKPVLFEMLMKAGVKIITNATVSRITENSVCYKDADGLEHEIPAAQVVSAFGYKSYNPLEEIAKKHCSEVHVIGTASKPGNALVAGKDAFETGIAI